MIGESLTDVLTFGSLLLTYNANEDDDICGVSLSIRFGTNLVSVWNRVAPENVPISVHTPQSGKASWSPGVIQEEQTPMTEKGVEKMKDVILSELTEELRPQSWFYRVCVLWVTRRLIIGP